MTRSERLDPLIRVAQQRQDAVAKQLAEREKTVNEQQQRLDLLKDYADSFTLSPAGSTLSPAMLANHVAFRGKLDVAVKQQTQAVDTSVQHREIERTRLMLASRNSKVLEQLAASYRADELYEAGKREQRELDDIGARRVRAAQEGGTP